MRAARVALVCCTSVAARPKLRKILPGLALTAGPVTQTLDIEQVISENQNSWEGILIDVGQELQQ